MGALRSVHYPLAFSTLACPNWSWEQAVQKAVEYGYQGLELRGVEGEMDLTKAAPFTSSEYLAGDARTGTPLLFADSGWFFRRCR